MAGGRTADRMQLWIDARKRHRLSHAQVQMARELGMNPKKLGKIDNHEQERWKLPLPEFIEELYYKRFRKDRPDVVLSIEERANRRQQKKKQRREKITQPKERGDGYGSGSAQNDEDIPF